MQLQIPAATDGITTITMGRRRRRRSDRAGGRTIRQAEVGNVLRNLQQSLDETIGHPRRNTGYAGSNNSSALLLPGLLFSLPLPPIILCIFLSSSLPSLSLSLSHMLSTLRLCLFLHISTLYGLFFSFCEHFSSLPRIIHFDGDYR